MRRRAHREPQHRSSSVEYLWSPWRYDYIAASGKKPGSCVFCIGEDRQHDADRLVLFRGVFNFLILNLFPYTSGHLMIAPYAHVDRLQDLRTEQTSEMMDLARRATGALEKLYRPAGYNIGMNLGESAGAGVKDHLHLHVVPRWVGDSNFMTITGETRVLPEELHVTFSRLSQVL
jgi:ATP adenylyltransferase